MTLYHYCCDHSASIIAADGWLRPSPHTGLLWLTDLDKPDRWGLGLTMETITCDRTRHRFTTEGEAEWWPHYCRRVGIGWKQREALETHGKPRHWFVSTEPLAVVDYIDIAG